MSKAGEGEDALLRDMRELRDSSIFVALSCKGLTGEVSHLQTFS